MAPFTEGVFVKALSENHSVVFNKFPVFKNHLLVITRLFED